VCRADLGSNNIESTYLAFALVFPAVPDGHGFPFCNYAIGSIAPGKLYRDLHNEVILK
jgi:hypothetical protein